MDCWSTASLQLKTKSQLQKSKRRCQSTEVNHGYPGFLKAVWKIKFSELQFRCCWHTCCCELKWWSVAKHFISCWVVGSFYPSRTVIGQGGRVQRSGKAFWLVQIPKLSCAMTSGVQGDVSLITPSDINCDAESNLEDNTDVFLKLFHFNNISVSLMHWFGSVVLGRSQKPSKCRQFWCLPYQTYRQ